MKVAYHFDADHPSLGKSWSYGWSVEQHVLGLIAGRKRFGLSTKVFIGDLLLDSLAENTVVLDEGLHQITVDQARLAVAAEAWLRPRERMWVRLLGRQDVGSAGYPASGRQRGAGVPGISVM